MNHDARIIFECNRLTRFFSLSWPRRYSQLPSPVGTFPARGCSTSAVQLLLSEICSCDTSSHRVWWSCSSGSLMLLHKSSTRGFTPSETTIFPHVFFCHFPLSNANNLVHVIQPKSTWQATKPNQFPNAALYLYQWYKSGTFWQLSSHELAKILQPALALHHVNSYFLHVFDQ